MFKHVEILVGRRFSARLNYGRVYKNVSEASQIRLRRFLYNKQVVQSYKLGGRFFQHYIV